MNKLQPIIESTGVEYITKIIKITEYNKENKENIVVATQVDEVASTPGGIVDASPTSQVGQLSGSLLNADMVQMAAIQLWENKSTKGTRVKLKVSLTLVGELKQVEFICSLTKDMRNFKKFIPEPGRSEIIDLARDIRFKIKNEEKEYPYIGKFHLNVGWNSKGAGFIQIEPETFAAVWYDAHYEGFRGILKIYDWTLNFDLFEDRVSDKQSKAGLISQTIYKNPKYDRTIRPKTWAEQRRGL